MFGDQDEYLDAEDIISSPVPMDPATKKTPPPAPEVAMAKLNSASSKGMTDVILGAVQQNNATLAERYPVVKSLNQAREIAQADMIVQAATIGENNVIVQGAKLLADQQSQL